MQGIKNNLPKIFIGVLCLVLATIWYANEWESNQATSTIELTEAVPSPENKIKTSSRLDLQNEVNRADMVKAPETTPAEISKMILFAVVVAVPEKFSSAVILFNLSPENYVIGEKIGSTEAILKEVKENYVIVALDSKQYALNLIGGKADDAPEENITSNNNDIASMTAEQIGNRPKQLNHIISISPENSDYSVAPGINPKLFKDAKFKDGDILQSINGKDINDPEQLAQANALIATAQTLKFEVNRNGIIVILYLDIPSDDLSISY